MNLSTNPPSAAVTGEPTQPRKFMFDQSFDQLVAKAQGQDRNKPVTLKPEQLEQIKREAYDQGFAAAQASAQEAEAAQHTRLLARIDEQVTRALHKMDAMRGDQDQALRGIIMAIARKILPGFAMRHGLDEVEAMLTAVIGVMQHEPRLVVRVHETQLDAINTKLGSIVAQKAYSGKVVVLADAELGAGDCRVEWADGGIERKADDVWQQIEAIVNPTDVNSADTSGDGATATPDHSPSL